jgi:hypothetical protein
MVYSLTQFENNTSNQLSALDNNFLTATALAPMPCSVAGTNTLALTLNAAGLVPTNSITAYTNYMIFSGVAAATNTSAVTAALGSLAALPVYKDGPSGPVALTGGEIVAGCAFTLTYDSALNSGNGGFHLEASTAGTSLRVNSGSTLTMVQSGSVSMSFTATPGWSSQDQTFTLTGLPPTLPLVGDFVQLCPPSLAAIGVGYQGMVTAVGSLTSVASVSTLNIRLINSASASIAGNAGLYRWSATRLVP